MVALESVTYVLASSAWVRPTAIYFSCPMQRYGKLYKNSVINHYSLL